MKRGRTSPSSWARTLAAGVLVGAAVALSPIDAHAQTAAPPPSTQDEPDAVMLKHGGVIKGKVTEMLPGDHATVAMPGGQNAIVRWDEIGSISRGGVIISMPASAAPAPTAPPPATATPAPARGQERFYGPAKMPYEDDEPIPPGYHVEKHARLGLLITGAILTGIGVLGIVAYDAQGDVTGSDRLGFDLVWGALFMGPGLPLLIVGLASSSKQLVRDDLGGLHPSAHKRANLTPVPKPSPFFFGVDPRKDHPGVRFGVTF